MTECNELVGIITDVRIEYDLDYNAAVAKLTWALSNGFHVGGTMTMPDFGALLAAFQCSSDSLVGKPCYMVERDHNICVFGRAWVVK